MRGYWLFLTLLVLLMLAPVIATGQALTPNTGIMRQSDCSALTCTSGRQCIDTESGEFYVCADTDADGTNSWENHDIPGCALADTDGDGAAGPSPPSGTCDTNAACQVTGSLYLCNAGTWAAVSGGGGDSVSVDGTATTDPDFLSTGDVDFVYDGTGDVTANVRAAVLTGAEFAITLAQAFGSWTWDGDGDGTDERVACGDYDDDGTLELTDIDSCRSLLPPPFTYSVSFDNDGDGTSDPQYTESYYVTREIHLVPGRYTGGTKWNWTEDGLLFDGHGAILQSTFNPFDGANGCLSSTGGSSSNEHLFFSIQDGSDDFVNEVTFQNFVMQGIGSVEPLMTQNGSSSVSDPDGDGTLDGNCQKNFEITNPRNVFMRNVISRDSWRTNIFVNNNYSDDDTDGTVGHSHSMLIDNVTIDGHNGHQGFEVQGGVTIINSRVSGVENRTATSAAIGGTLAGGAGPVIIKNNKLHDVSQAISFSTETNADADADGTVDGTAPAVEQVIIEGNEIWDYDEPAIQITTAGGSATTYSPLYGAVIRGNLIADCGRYDRTTARRSVLQFQENNADIRQGIIEQNQIIDCDLTSADFEDNGDGTLGDDVMVIDVEGDDLSVSKNIIDITVDGTSDAGTQEDGAISMVGNNIYVTDNIIRARNLDQTSGTTFYAINLGACDDCVVSRNHCDFTAEACTTNCQCVSMIGNTNRLKVKENSLNCNASDAQSVLLEGVTGTHDQVRFFGNDQTEGASMAQLTAVTLTEGFFGHNIATGLSGAFYSVDSLNDFLDMGYSGVGNSTQSEGFDPDNERAFIYSCDRNTEDGVLDSHCGFVAMEKSFFGFVREGNANGLLDVRVFTDTCGASECVVFDLDADGTTEAGDICLVDLGPDYDCDGTENE